LYKAITHHFGSYEDALVYAEFDPKKIHKGGERRSKSLLIKEIIRFHVAGADLNESRIVKGGTKKLKKIYWDAEKKFGGWEKAVTTAGIDYDRFRRRRKNGYWGKESILQGIKNLDAKNIPLNAGYVAAHHLDLHRAASRYMGGWENSLTEAGFDPEQIRLNGKSLSKKELVDKIKEFANKGNDLNVEAMLGGEYEQRRVCSQSWRRFGNWDNALTEAGMDPKKIRKKRKKYSLEELAKEVKGFEKQGMSLSLEILKNNSQVPHAKQIISTVSKRFDSWRNFLDKIGVDSDRYCKATDWKGGEGVVSYLQETFESGVVTGSSKDRNFAVAAGRYFGTIGAAVDKAGLIYSHSGKITREMLEDPKVLGILYKKNADFLQNIAKKIFFAAHKFRSGRTLGLEDLTHEAFLTLVEVLPEKPPKMGLREFAYDLIRKKISKENREIFKEEEVLFEEEAYLDLFIDEDFDW